MFHSPLHPHFPREHAYRPTHSCPVSYRPRFGEVDHGLAQPADRFAATADGAMEECVPHGPRRRTSCLGGLCLASAVRRHRKLTPRMRFMSSCRSCDDYVGRRNQLAQGSRIEVRDFASLRVRRLGGKLGRNPRTGEAVSVPARYVVRFKPGKRLRDGAVSSVVASNWRKVGAGTQPGATPAAAPPD